MAALKHCKACIAVMQCTMYNILYTRTRNFIHFMRVLYSIEYGSIPYSAGNRKCKSKNLKIKSGL